jgi:hypothetical protein
MKNMRFKQEKIFFLFILVIGLTLGLSISFQSLFADYTAPLHNPPTCLSGEPGCDAPLNIGSSPQNKMGTLQISNGLIVQGGNVGIGTDNPNTKLNLYDSASGPIINLQGRTTNYRGIKIADTGNDEKWFAGANDSNNYVIRKAGATDALTVGFASGNVGIGKAAPGEKLEVDGSVYVNKEGSGFIVDAGVGGNKRVGLMKYSGIEGALVHGNNVPLRFGQVNQINVTGGTFTTQMLINNSGNVGIGTTTPSALLTLSAEDRTGGEPTYGGVLKIITGGGATSTVGGIEFKMAAAGSGYGWRITAPNLGTGETPLYFQKRSNSAAWTDAMTILGTNNFIGVGTTSPQGMLDIFNSSSSVTLTTFSGYRSLSLVNINTTNNNANGLVFRTMDANGTLTTGSKIMGVYTSHTASAVSGDIAFLTNNAGTVSEKMRILSSGNVGIGTQAPGALLEVTKNVSGALGPVLKLRNRAGAHGDQMAIDFATGHSTNDSENRARILGYVEQGGQGRLDFYTKDGRTVNWANVPDMTVKAGSVGIGTTTPQFPPPNGGAGNLDVNDVYIRSTNTWVSQSVSTHPNTIPPCEWSPDSRWYICRANYYVAGFSCTGDCGSDNMEVLCCPF